MQWVTIADLQARFDPKVRLAYENQHLKKCIAQAQFEQADRHHAERMRIESMKMDAKADAERTKALASIEKEKIAGQNALNLANRNHVLGQLTQGSQLIDSMIHSQLKQQEDWNNIVADTMRQLFVSEADTIKQQRLKELEHKHKIESLTLEYNLRTAEMILQNEMQKNRIPYDKLCEIMFKLVEGKLGLGEKMTSREEEETEADRLIKMWEAGLL
jgi:hypothetical protein